MKTETVGISTKVGDVYYPGPTEKDKLTLEYQVPETVDEAIAMVGVDPETRGSVHDLTTSEWRTRFANGFRAKYREELSQEGMNPESVRNSILTQSVGWNPTTSLGGRVDAMTSLKRELAGKSPKDQIARMREIQAELEAQLAEAEAVEA